MQETKLVLATGQTRLIQEFFKAASDIAVTEKMDARLEELKAEGHTLSRRLRIGRNDPCPCGSGKKYKKCHLGSER